MSKLNSEIASGVDSILKKKISVNSGTVVPNTGSLCLWFGGVKIDGTVLYADLEQSSELVDDFHQNTAAKIIKCFLYCGTKLITNNGGTVTSFDGDRVMGVFVGNSKNTSAVKTALQIKYAVNKILKPRAASYFSSYSESAYEIDHAVGVDTSGILAVRAGQKGSNDLIWIGRSPNFAAKLSSLREGSHSTIISESIYSNMHDDVKYGGTPSADMWEKRQYPWIGKSWTVYRSNWWFSI